MSWCRGRRRGVGLGRPRSCSPRANPSPENPPPRLVGAGRPCRIGFRSPQPTHPHVHSCMAASRIACPPRPASHPHVPSEPWCSRALRSEWRDARPRRRGNYVPDTTAGLAGCPQSPRAPASALGPSRSPRGRTRNLAAQQASAAACAGRQPAHHRPQWAASRLANRPANPWQVRRGSRAGGRHAKP